MGRSSIIRAIGHVLRRGSIIEQPDRGLDYLGHVAPERAASRLRRSTTRSSGTNGVLVIVDGAPEELSGTWTTQVGSVQVALTLEGDRYSITRGSASGSGMISVVGDQITFSGSSLCSGVGTYTWSVDGETLAFEASDPMDPCSGRTSVLLGVVFTGD
ncbi:MAG: hypothetical protein WD651_13425 [Acidimicrobiia bacterium]